MCSPFFMVPLTLVAFFIVVLIYFFIRVQLLTLLCQFLLYTKGNQPSVQSLSHVRPFVTPWTAARQVSLSITNSWSLCKLMSTESVMPSNHLIFCHPLLLPPLIFPSIGVFANESVPHIRWPKYWSFMFQHPVFPMNSQG